MKILYLPYLIAFSLLYPTATSAQEWDSAVDHINETRTNINQLYYRVPSNEEAEHVDSIFIKKNKDYEKVVIQLYNTTVELNDPVEYITAVELPVVNLVEVSNFNGELKLGFSRDCNSRKEAELDYLEIYVDSEKDSYLLNAAFKHLKYTTEKYHKLQHDASVCGFRKK
ncbi:hypothetical protein ML462_08475 [Gramella lutea]|uniref:Uncharacterized protein n=1 Tax=Christiangramia lutea TaxID=1607951 RepID=A0A9X1V5W1_9FLAO|nr:hypothetical protein [Christiangramia lutea]MCH4823208.1 hypothetical protein [Christiangramia lutea]